MPVEPLRLLLSYDPITGVLRWLLPKQGRRRNGPAGSEQSMGYVVVMIDGQRYQAHRIIWYLITGDWIMVDHRNGDGYENRIDNLRPATMQENGWNSRGYAASGYKGVYATKSGKWTARIKIGGKIINFPSRATAEEAHADYCAAAIEHHGAFARLS